MMHGPMNIKKNINPFNQCFLTLLCFQELRYILTYIPCSKFEFVSKQQKLVTL